MRTAFRCALALVFLGRAMCGYTLHGNVRAHSFASDSPSANVLWLHPHVPIADPPSSLSGSSPFSSTFNWPITVPADTACKRVVNVSVDIIGLQHPNPQSLSIHLRHATAGAVLARATPARRFGSSRDRHPSSIRTAAAPERDAASSYNRHIPLSDSPNIWTFADTSNSLNIARGKRCDASGYLYGAKPSRATDGATDGYFSRSGLFHSGPAIDANGEPIGSGVSPIGSVPPGVLQNWLEVDLLLGNRNDTTTTATTTTTTVGAVRILDRALEGYAPDVYLIRTHTLEKIRGGTFRLRMRLPPARDMFREGEPAPLVSLTPPIPFDAPAMRVDEPANATGSSMQAALESLPSAGSVIVTRSASSPQKGTYKWLVTFVNRASLPPLEAVEVGEWDQGEGAGTLFAQGANVSVSLIRRGKAHTWYDDEGKAADVFARCAALDEARLASSLVASSSLLQKSTFVGSDPSCACGFAPGYLLLTTEPLGNITLGAAIAHNATVFAKRLDCRASQTNEEPFLSSRSTQQPHEREVVVPVLPPRSARYIRIQRADAEYLWISEVQAFAQTPSTLSGYTGGASEGVMPGTYEAESSLASAFADLPAEGPWLLQLITDSSGSGSSAATAAAGDVTGTAATADAEESLPASLSTWALHITCDGQEPEELVDSPFPSAYPDDGSDLDGPGGLASSTFPTSSSVAGGAQASFPSDSVADAWAAGGASGGGGSGGWGNVVTRSYAARVEVHVHSFPSGGKLLPLEVKVGEDDDDGEGWGRDDATTRVGGQVPSAASIHPGMVPPSILSAATTSARIGLQAEYAQCVPGQLTRRNADGSQTECEHDNAEDNARRLLRQRTDGAVAWTGDASLYVHSSDASIDASTPPLLRLVWEHNRHSVVYHPYDGYAGADVFVVSTVVDAGDGDGVEVGVVHLTVGDGGAADALLRPTHGGSRSEGGAEAMGGGAAGGVRRRGLQETLGEDTTGTRVFGRAGGRQRGRGGGEGPA